MQATESSPVDHLLRGIVPDAVVDAMQNPERSQMGEEPMVPTPAPSGEPRKLGPGEKLPNGIVICCEDVARNSSGLMIFYGVLDNLWVTKFPAQYNVTIVLIMTKGSGSYSVTIDIVHESGNVAFSMPPVNADVNPTQKFIMYQQLHGWPIMQPGRYDVVAKVDGHEVGSFPIGVYEKSVKSVDVGVPQNESK